MHARRVRHFFYVLQCYFFHSSSLSEKTFLFQQDKCALKLFITRIIHKDIVHTETQNIMQNCAHGNGFYILIPILKLLLYTLIVVIRKHKKHLYPHNITLDPSKNVLVTLHE